MTRIKHIGASPLTGTIYSGTLNTDKQMWVGNKTDVTDMATRAVAEHLKVTKKKIAFGLIDGRYIILQATVVDQLPDEYFGRVNIDE